MMCLVGLVVIGIFGCSGGRTAALPEDPDEKYLPVTYDTVFAKSEVDQAPEFKGGLEAVVDRMWYPREALRQGISGRVIVEFVVSPEGSPTNVKVTDSVHSLLDREALRVVLASELVPGRKGERHVPVRMTLPLTFR
jgi:TonB family protein